MTVTKRKLLASVVAAAVCVLCVTPSVQASAIQLNGFSDMTAGGTLAAFPGGAPANPLTMTADGITLTFSTDLSGFTFDDGSFFAFPAGMTPVLLNNQGNGPITIEFSKGVQEFGFLAQSAGIDIETFTFDVFGPSSLLKSFSVGPADNTGFPAGLALFIGSRATGTDLITKLIVSSTSSQEFVDNFFAVGPMTFVRAPAAEAVPEPASLLLLGSGLAGAVVRMRKRHTRR